MPPPCWAHTDRLSDWGCFRRSALQGQSRSIAPACSNRVPIRRQRNGATLLPGKTANIVAWIGFVAASKGRSGHVGLGSVRCNHERRGCAGRRAQTGAGILQALDHGRPAFCQVGLELLSCDANAFRPAALRLRARAIGRNAHAGAADVFIAWIAKALRRPQIARNRNSGRMRIRRTPLRQRALRAANEEDRQPEGAGLGK